MFSIKYNLTFLNSCEFHGIKHKNKRKITRRVPEFQQHCFKNSVFPPFCNVIEISNAVTVTQFCSFGKKGLQLKVCYCCHYLCGRMLVPEVIEKHEYLIIAD